MKKILIAAIALSTSIAFAQSVSEKTTKTTTTAADGSVSTNTTTTTSTGTITEYAPGKTFVVKETTGPVTYTYGKTVAYVTKSGRVLTDDQVRTRIKIGLPVHVVYATEAGGRVITRVEIED